MPKAKRVKERDGDDDDEEEEEEEDEDESSEESESGSEAGAYTRSLSAELELSLCPTSPKLTRECVPNELKLSSNVNECKPLVRGRGGGGAGSGVGRELRDPRGDRRSHPPRHRQGLTLVHFSAQCKHILWDSLGA